jgi:hypothetical protein
MPLADLTSKCVVIMLAPRATYELPDQIVVRRRVTISGRPGALPLIDATTVIRSFMVESGGAIDVRFATFHRGMPQPVIPGRLIELRGSTAYVKLGGSGESSMLKPLTCRRELVWDLSGLIGSLCSPQRPLPAATSFVA